MEQINERLQTAQRKHQKVRFSLTEAELNEYLAWELQTQQRPGVRQLQLRVAPQNSVGIAAVIDLDAVARWKPNLIPPLLHAMLHGTKNMDLEARFQAERGGITFQVERTAIEGVPLPPTVVQRILEEVAARQPEHYDLTRPVKLPAGVQRVWTRERVVEGEN